jgi:CRP-like cAMP-binding protein
VGCDTILVREGESPRQVLVLADGLLAATTIVGRSHELMLPGATFGEAAVLSHTPYTRTVTALERSCVLVIEARAFRDLVQRFPTISARLAKTFAGSVAASDRRIDDRRAALLGQRDAACSRTGERRRTKGTPPS